MENTTSLRNEIRSFIIENYMFERDLPLADSESLIDSGIIDSTGVLQLVGHLEETYGISVADDELIPDNLDSIANITAYVSRKTIAVEPSAVEIHSVAAAEEVAL